MTTAHAKLQEELKSMQASLESHQRGMEEAKDAHSKANESLAELRAAKISDDSVLAEVKAELSQKEKLLSQAMADLQTTAQIEEKLRSREEEIENVRAEHQEQHVALREQSSGVDEAAKAKHEAEIEVSCPQQNIL
jgi:chromosome segregation ATPase